MTVATTAARLAQGRSGGRIPVTQFRRLVRSAVASELKSQTPWCSAAAHGAAPSARTVLLQGLLSAGASYSSSTTRAAGQRDSLPTRGEPALSLVWVGAQVANPGRAERISAAESLSYFLSRSVREAGLGGLGCRARARDRSRSILEAIGKQKNAALRWFDGATAAGPGGGPARAAIRVSSSGRGDRTARRSLSAIGPRGSGRAQLLVGCLPG